MAKSIKVGIIGKQKNTLDESKEAIAILSTLLALRQEKKAPFVIVTNGLTVGIGGLASRIADMCGDSKMSVFCLMAPIGTKFRDMKISQLVRASQEDTDALFIDQCDVIIVIKSDEEHPAKVAQAARIAGKQVIDVDPEQVLKLIFEEK